jgi:hypothetical protein
MEEFKAAVAKGKIKYGHKETAQDRPISAEAIAMQRTRTPSTDTKANMSQTFREEQTTEPWSFSAYSILGSPANKPFQRSKYRKLRIRVAMGFAKRRILRM